MFAVEQQDFPIEDQVAEGLACVVLWDQKLTQKKKKVRYFISNCQKIHKFDKFFPFVVAVAVVVVVVVVAVVVVVLWGDEISINWVGIQV